MGPAPREDPDRQTDFDRRFAEIVAHLAPEESRWDPAGGRDAARTSGDEGEGSTAVVDTPREDGDDAPPADAGSGAPLAGLPAQWRMPVDGSSSILDEQDDFVPAPPRPLPSGEDDLGFWSMLGCLVAGPAWLLYLFFFDSYAQPLWWVLACALFVAGVVQLVMRSPKNRDDQDEDDDGAVL